MHRIGLVFVFFFTLSFSTFAAPSQSNEKLSKKQLAVLIASATTAAEHRRIANYFNSEAQQLLAESNEHVRMEADFRGHAPNKSTPFQVDHCEYLARTLKEKADKAIAAAVEHDRMAQAAESR